MISLVAALQSAFPAETTRMFAFLGDSAYLAKTGGVVKSSLRYNSILGYAVPRAGSLMLSDLGLAFFLLLAVPVTFAWSLHGSATRRAVCHVLALGSLGTAALTLTRSAMLAIPAGLVVVGVSSKRIAATALLAIEAAILGAAVAIPLHLFDFLGSVLQGAEGSFGAHLDALTRSLREVQSFPFGLGLGMGGAVAQRFAPGVQVNESWYFQLTTEIGIIGVALFVAVLAGLAISLVAQAGQTADRDQALLCYGMLGALLGFFLVGAVLHVWEALTASMEFWLFAGLALAPATALSAGRPPIHALTRWRQRLRHPKPRLAANR
jgi:hypothetical protein